MPGEQEEWSGSRSGAPEQGPVMTWVPARWARGAHRDPVVGVLVFTVMQSHCKQQGRWRPGSLRPCAGQELERMVELGEAFRVRR